MIVVITGRPGIGKSTVFNRVISRLKALGLNIYGFYCPEVREGPRRIGFKIIDIHTNDQGWLAISMDKAIQMGFNRYSKRIGKYFVVYDEAKTIGINALRRIYSDPNGILGIDEIGPMELSIDELRKEIISAIMKSSKALLVIHKNLSDKNIIDILKRKNTVFYTVLESNREFIHDEIAKIFVNTFTM